MFYVAKYFHPGIPSSNAKYQFLNYSHQFLLNYSRKLKSKEMGDEV